jgi:hypothetical protein
LSNAVCRHRSRMKKCLRGQICPGTTSAAEAIRRSWPLCPGAIVAPTSASFRSQVKAAQSRKFSPWQPQSFATVHSSFPGCPLREGRLTWLHPACRPVAANLPHPAAEHPPGRRAPKLRSSGPTGFRQSGLAQISCPGLRALSLTANGLSGLQPSEQWQVTRPRTSQH